MSRLERIAFVPDVHAPYHDPAVVDAGIVALEEWQPNVVVVLGDLWDFYKVSTFDKDPARRQTLAEEIVVGQTILDTIVAVTPSARHIFCEGNHEARLARFVARKAPELHGLVPTAKDLVNATGSWEFVPYMERLALTPRLYTSHEFGSYSSDAPFTALRDWPHSTVFGHTHRLGIEYGGTLDGVRHAAMVCGWWGDPVRVDYQSRAKTLRDSTHGMGAAYIDKKGNHYLRPVPYVDGRMML